MNDKEFELLKLAGKAVNLQIRREDGGEIAAFKYDRCWIFWNPLASDRDALRLAVSLGLNIQTEGCAFITCDRLDNSVLVKYKGGDVFSYVRQAIVRAAAEIGRLVISDYD